MCPLVRTASSAMWHHAGAAPGFSRCRLLAGVCSRKTSAVGVAWREPTRRWKGCRRSTRRAMSEAPAKRAKLAVEGVNGSSSGSASAQVASPRRAARAVVDTDAELMEADNAVPNGEETEITDAMAAENAKCDTPSHHRAH